MAAAELNWLLGSQCCFSTRHTVLAKHASMFTCRLLSEPDTHKTHAAWLCHPVAHMGKP